MTQYYTHMYSMPGKLLVVGQQEQEGDLHNCNVWWAQAVWGIQAWRPEMQQAILPPATAPHTKESEDAHKFWVKDDMGKKHAGLPGDLVASLTELSV